MRYRVFVQDVGESGYSGLQDVTADNPKQAVRALATDKSRGTHHKALLIALPHNRMDLWPNSTTGAVPDEALSFR